MYTSVVAIVFVLAGAVDVPFMAGTSHTRDVDDVSQYVEYQTKQVLRWSSSPKEYWSGTRGKMFLDGERVDLRTQTWEYDSEPAFPLGAIAEGERTIWDGTNHYYYTELAEGGLSNILAVSEKKSKRDRFVNYVPTAPLSGRFTGTRQSLQALMANGENMASSLVDENGRTLRHVEFDSAEGHHELWFDVEKGDSLCRAKVTKGIGDIHFGSPVGEAETVPPPPLPPDYDGPPPAPASGPIGIEITLDDVTFANESGNWIPIRGEWTLTEIFDGGLTAETHTVYEASEVDLAPDFASLGAFIPTPRNGTPVQYVDSAVPANDLEWRDGAVYVKASEAELKRLESRFDSYGSASAETVTVAPPALASVDAIGEPRSASWGRVVVLLFISAGIAAVCAVAIRMRGRRGASVE